ncbi:hypothetical protein [Mycobacterium lehmannii]|uniref:hypothetical protein n=1 Tax=Mycobacterium lehmannii TaxID=2048550 RepID=UPI000A661174|nr:hypothetical protein [Mycobacterium lehmannii]
MTGHQTGPPPGSERPAPPQDRLSHRVTTNATKSTAAANKPGAHKSRDRRRRAAEYRSPRLNCGHRDPWLCDCNTGPFLSDVRADAAIAAAETLLALGTPGIFDADRCRAMWRRGRRDLAASSHSYANPEEHHGR